MNAVQLVAHRTLEPRVIPEAREPGPGEVLVRVKAVGICGSDMHWYLDGHIGGRKCAYPHILGHEPSGEVALAGAGVDLKPGDRVIVEPAHHCGHCEFCLSGRYNVCPKTSFMGSPPEWGFFRDYVTVSRHNVVPVPQAMAFDEATLVEPLAVILHVMELAPVRIGDTVAVLGCGPIGLLTIAVAKACGASRIYACDKVRERVAMARAMGAETAIHTESESFRDAVLDQTRGRGVDAVYDAAAFTDTINLGMAVVRQGGRFVLIGLPVERIDLDMIVPMMKEVNFQAIKRSNPVDSHAAIRMLEAGRIPLGLITHRYALERTGEAFETIAAYRDGIGKAIVEI